MDRNGDGKTGAEDKPTWGEAIGSALSAFIGVQSNAKRERDFGRNHPGRFILAGVVMTAAFVGSLMLLVHLLTALTAS